MGGISGEVLLSQLGKVDPRVSVDPGSKQWSGPTAPKKTLPEVGVGVKQHP